MIKLLSKIIDAVPSLSFYEKDIILHYLIDFKSQEEKQKYINEVLIWIKSNQELKSQFIKILNKEKKTDLFINLFECNYFCELMLDFNRHYFWQLINYLNLCASNYEDEFIQIVNKIDSRSHFICNEIIRVLSSQNEGIISKCIKNIEEWVNSGLLISTPEFPKIISKLENSGRWNDARRLVRILLSPVIMDQSDANEELYFHDMKSVVDKYLIDLIYEDFLGGIIDKYPFDLFEVGFVCFQEIPRNESFYWMISSIEESNQNFGENLGVYLVKIIRDSLLIVSNRDSKKARYYLDELLKSNDLIFQRIAIYVIGEHSILFPDLVDNLYKEKIYLIHSEYHHEFWNFVRKTFTNQSMEDKTAFIDFLFHLYDNEKDKYQLFRWLWAVKDSIEGQIKIKFLELYNEIGQPEHQDFLSYHQSLGGPLSPVDKEELLTMSAAQINKLLHLDIPVEAYGAVAQEGFVLVLQEAVKENPAKFADLSDFFDPKVIPPIYVYHFIQGLNDGWKSGKDFSWEPVFKQLDFLYSLADEDLLLQTGEKSWRAMSMKDIRRSILRLLSSAIRTKNHLIEISQLNNIRDFLINSFDQLEKITDEKKQIEKTHLGVITLAINENKAIATETMINYALHYANVTFGKSTSTKQKLEPKVKEFLEKNLIANEGLAVHSIFGKYFPNLIYLDEEWTKQIIELIFPAQNTKREKFVSAWGSYLYRGDFFNVSYKMLKEQYKLGINLLDDGKDYGTGIEDVLHRIFYHLYFAFWRDLEPMFGEESLIQLFLTIASDEDISKFVRGLGSGLKTVNPEKDSQQWIDLKRFWEVRFEYLRIQPQNEVRQELAAYLSWVEFFPEDITNFYNDIRLAALSSEPHYVFDFLNYLSEKDRHIPFAINLLEQFLQEIYEPWVLHRKDELFSNLLEKGMNLNKNTKKDAIKAINRLGELGLEQYRPLLDI